MHSSRGIQLAVCLALTLGAVRPVGAQIAAPVDRWQVTFDDGRYVWDVRLVKLGGDTLIVRHSDSLVRAPVARIDEMRMFRPTVLRVGDEHESAIRALAGDQDQVYDLAQLGLAERRRTIQAILSDRPPGGSR